MTWPAGMFLTPDYVEKVLNGPWMPHFLRKTQHRPARAPDMHFITRALQRPDGWGRTLEFGAWPTYHALWAMGWSEEVVVTDSFEWCDRADCHGPPKEEWAKDLKDYGPQILVGQEDITAMKVEEMFDTIFSVSVLEHVRDDKTAFERIFRALKPGGRFAFTTEANLYINMPYQEDTYTRIYDVKSLMWALDGVGFKFPQGGIQIPTDPRYLAAMNLALREPALLKDTNAAYYPLGIWVYKPEEE